MWILLSLAAALFQVLRNTVMKRLGHSLDEYINVWGRFMTVLRRTWNSAAASERRTHIGHRVKRLPSRPF